MRLKLRLLLQTEHSSFIAKSNIEEHEIIGTGSFPVCPACNAQAIPKSWGGSLIVER